MVIERRERETETEPEEYVAAYGNTHMAIKTEILIFKTT
jgi:hypothetical protein